MTEYFNKIAYRRGHIIKMKTAAVLSHLNILYLRHILVPPLQLTKILPLFFVFKVVYLFRFFKNSFSIEAEILQFLFQPKVKIKR